ncbi:hypothetical protein [Larkinella punicea]|uniref:Uncharacterized protein n=1 Tax=Larkinella punicea TaxID=2315727 RepID=A0A368JKX1_9BACT|nr:hypothetical protein [Larkinella punicea]RCR68307.1 hypothetical protein DUE52_18095 [Larkinella punicea]
MIRATIAGIWLNHPNRFLQSLCGKALELVKDAIQIDSPEMFVDMLEDWIGEHYQRFPKCNPESVVILYRKYSTGPEIRIYRDRGKTLAEVMRISVGDEGEEDAHICPVLNDNQELVQWSLLIRSCREVEEMQRKKRVTGKIYPPIFEIDGNRAVSLFAWAFGADR